MHRSSPRSRVLLAKLAAALAFSAAPLTARPRPKNTPGGRRGVRVLHQGILRP